MPTSSKRSLFSPFPLLALLALLLAIAFLLRSRTMEWVEFCAVFALAVGAGIAFYREALTGWIGRGRHPRDLRFLAVSGAMLLWFAGLAIRLEVPAGPAAGAFLVLESALALRYRRQRRVPAPGAQFHVPPAGEG